MQRGLTELEVRSLVARARASGGRADVRDGAVKGLELRVGPRGATWRVSFPDRRRGGRRDRMPLGEWPSVTLSEARRRAMAVRAMATDPLQPRNPAAERRERRGAVTLREAVEGRLSAVGGRALSPRTVAEYRWCLERYALPRLGDAPVAEVTPADVVAVVDAVEARGSLVQADRTRAALSSVLRWCVDRRLVASNPCAGLGRRSSSRPRERVLSDDELRALLRALRGRDDEGSRAILLLMLTGQRSGDVRGAEASELRPDGLAEGRVRFDGPLWRIPGARLVDGEAVGGRTKNRRDHLLPLAPWAASLLLGASDGALFPSLVDHRSVSKRFSTLCRRAGVDGARAHDLRRTFASACSDAGHPPHVVRRLLNHSPTDVTGRHYDMARLLPQMLDCLTWWEGHLRSIRATSG